MVAMNRRNLVKYAASAFPFISSKLAAAIGEPRPTQTLEKDIGIIGAGASGLYAASRLRELGYDVVVLEKTDRPGGHSQTLHSPTGKHVDMGVRIYPDIPFVRNVFDKHQIKYKTQDINGGNRVYINFDKGEVSPYQSPSQLTTLISLARYWRLSNSKYSYLGKEGYQLPNPVPPELTQPFGEFLQSNRLSQGYAPMTHYLQGFGRVHNMTTLYALKNLRTTVIEAAARNNFLSPENGVDELYQNISADLGKDLIFSAKLREVQRLPSGTITLLAESPRGIHTVICKQLLVTCPPLPGNLESFDLDDGERSLLGKFKPNYYWTAAMKLSGMDPELVLFNLAGKNPVTGQSLPGIYTMVPSEIPDVFNVLYGSEFYISDDEVKARIINDLERVFQNVYDGEPKFINFELFLNHSPYGLAVSPEDIQDGFYDKLNALQGQRGTYYLGAAIDTHDSASVWMHAESIIQKHFAP